MGRKVTIYYTSDTHGNLFPAENGGGSMLQCFGAYKKDGNTLILDGGDTIQGSPLLKYLRETGEFAKVIPWAFNQAGYDYFTLGNHDFNFGYEKLEEFLTAMEAECLTANLIDGLGRLPVKPWTLRVLENGLRVGICGVVTDCVNLWEAKENLEHLQVTDAFTAAKKALEEMKGQCDVTVCVYHGGYECDLETGNRLCKGKENVACEMLEKLDFDLLLTAHQHMETAGRTVNGTYTLQLPPNGGKYGKVELEEGEGGWKISGELIAPGEETPAAMSEALKPVQEAESRWRDRVIGSLAEEIPPEPLLERAMNGSRLADLGNQVQLWKTGADMACIGLANVPLGLERQVRLGDMLKVFPFPNRQVTLTVTGAVLKAALERCASYFDLEDGQVVISERFTKPKAEHYNYDYYAGVEYTADIRRPVGDRVSGVLVNGAPLEPERTYRLAMSDYRATGTGGYECFQSCPEPEVFPGDMQSTVLEYLECHPDAQVKPLGRVKVVW